MLTLTAVVSAPAFGRKESQPPVAQVVLGSINIEHGLSVLDTDDGQNDPATVGGSKCRVNRLDSDPPSHSMYFDYDNAAGKLKRPVYVTVDYFDEGFGAFVIQYDSSDLTSPGRGAYKNGAYELLLDSRKWRTVTFQLMDARFDGRQTSGADFRLFSAGRLAIRKVSIEMDESEGFRRQADAVRSRIAASVGRLKPAPNMKVVFGGIDALKTEDAEQVYADLKMLAPVLKGVGVTSVETCVTWAFVEPKKGVWDWRYYDGIVAILRENGLKWSPRLVIGPAYATPAWFLESKDSVVATCLEHGTPSKVQSIWNPYMFQHVDQFLNQFAKHCSDGKIVESVSLGVGGDAGESIYPVSNGGSMTSPPGNYHCHLGLWCGDDYACGDFRRYVKSRYGSIELLNKSWGSDYVGFDGVSPRVPSDGESCRRKLDTMNWYKDAMTRWTDQCISAARYYLSWADLAVCAAGDGHAELGADFAAQCKVAGRNKAEIRLANEASDYPLDFAVTRLTASAARFYRAGCSFAASKPITTEGIRSRVFNSAASEASGIHFDYPSVLIQNGGVDQWSKTYRWLRLDSVRRRSVAVLFPETALTLKWGGFYEKVMELRDAIDFDMVDESMVRDGALDNYKALVLIDGEVIERADFDRIVEWVKSGGTVIACDFGGMKTVEGDSGPFTSLFDESGKSLYSEKPCGTGIAYYVNERWGGTHSPAEGIATVLDSLSPRLQTNIVPDGVVDGVYMTDIGGKLLVLNTTSKPVERVVRVGIGRKKNHTLPAEAITEIKE